MKMNSGFNINLIITCEIEPRVLIHTVISAHVWSVDEARVITSVTTYKGFVKVTLILLYAFDRSLSNSIHKSKVNPINSELNTDKFYKRKQKIPFYRLSTCIAYLILTFNFYIDIDISDSYPVSCSLQIIIL